MNSDKSWRRALPGEHGVGQSGGRSDVSSCRARHPAAHDQGAVPRADIAEKSIEAVDETATKDFITACQPENKTGRWLTLALPPEVRGRVQVNLYDAETSELLYEQALVRESSRKLNVAILDGKESYQPGETVSLTLQFVDENGVAAAGAWGGVRVWNEQVVQSLGDRPLLLADALWADANASVELEGLQERLIAQNGQDACCVSSRSRKKGSLEEQSALSGSGGQKERRSESRNRPTQDQVWTLPRRLCSAGRAGGGLSETFSNRQPSAFRAMTSNRHRQRSWPATGSLSVRNTMQRWRKPTTSAVPCKERSAGSCSSVGSGRCSSWAFSCC
jgi:hypothetical protein